MSARGDFRKLVQQAIKRGWREVRHNRHQVLVWRTGENLVVPQSASDQRAIKNLRAEMRRIESGGVRKKSDANVGH